jgi:hypothetical protein
MTRKWKVILILVTMMLLVFSISLAWSAPQKASEPTFNSNDRNVVTEFYRHVMGTLAPGSVVRWPFSPAIERTLAAGSHVPMQLEKELIPLPNELESKLTPLTGEYRRFKLGPHVLLVKTADLSIVDIVKNAGMTK